MFLPLFLGIENMKTNKGCINNKLIKSGGYSSSAQSLDSDRINLNFDRPPDPKNNAHLLTQQESQTSSVHEYRIEDGMNLNAQLTQSKPPSKKRKSKSRELLMPANKTSKTGQESVLSSKKRKSEC